MAATNTVYYYVNKILNDAWMNKYSLTTTLFDSINSDEKRKLIPFATEVESILNDVAKSPQAKYLAAIERAKHNMLSMRADYGRSPQYLLIVLHIVSLFVNESHFKYKDVSAFLKEYGGFYDKCDEAEKNILKDVANWTVITMQIIPAKKNKGIVLAAVTKFVEGYDVNYITGSGQTAATANRVHIYEYEGNVVPMKRVKNKASHTIDSVDVPNKVIVDENGIITKIEKHSLALKTSKPVSKLSPKPDLLIPRSTHHHPHLISNNHYSNVEQQAVLGKSQYSKKINDETKIKQTSLLPTMVNPNSYLSLPLDTSQINLGDPYVGNVMFNVYPQRPTTRKNLLLDEKLSRHDSEVNFNFNSMTYANRYNEEDIRFDEYYDEKDIALQLAMGLEGPKATIEISELSYQTQLDPVFHESEIKNLDFSRRDDRDMMNSS